MSEIQARGRMANEEAREAVELSTEQVRVMFTGTHPQFYRPDQAERAEQFDRWLAARDTAMRAEGIRQAREAVARIGPFGDGSYEDEWSLGLRFHSEAALRAIDALLTDE